MIIAPFFALTGDAVDFDVDQVVAHCRRAFWSCDDAATAVLDHVCELVRGSASGSSAPATPQHRRARKSCDPRCGWRRRRSRSRSDCVAPAPARIRFSMRFSQPVPSRQGVHWPQDSDMIEARDALQHAHHAGGLVHHDDRGRCRWLSPTAFRRVVVHVGLRA